MRVSRDGRHLVRDDGSPFFYLADTAWGLFYDVTLAEAEDYLRARRDQGFSVIMPVLVWALEDTDRYFGRRPFVQHDPARPDERFWSHVDDVVDRANALGLVVAPLTTWGRYVVPATGDAPGLFTPQTARPYGEFLGRRYRDREVVWVLGGDRNPPPGADPAADPYTQTWEAMAAGLQAGHGGTRLMTFHPTAVASSSQWFHDAPWLDFHLWQTSTRLDIDYCQTLLTDFRRPAPKPFLDGETRYEHSHAVFGARPVPHGPRMTPRRVRQAAYYALLCGAAGHTYGCRDVWAFHVPGDRAPDRDMDTHWREALRFPAAGQLRHLRALFEVDCPWHRLRPDEDGSLVVYGRGDGNFRVQGAVADDASFAVVYVPDDMPAWVDLGRLAGEAVDAWWFDPRSGAYRFIQRFNGRRATRFYAPPAAGEDGQDNVLVLRAALYGGAVPPSTSA